MDFTWITFTFEVFTSIIAFIAVTYAYKFINKHLMFFGNCRYWIYVGLWLEAIHFFLDAVDTLIYMKNEMLWYGIVDSTEASLAIIGGLMLTYGIVKFSQTLIKVWDNPDTLKLLRGDKKK